MEMIHMQLPSKIKIVLGFVLIFIRHSSSLSITVANIECISEHVLYEDDTVSGNFVVADRDVFWSADHPGIDLTVTSPAGNIVHSVRGSSGDKFDFRAKQSGIYKFCFHNPWSSPETISFYIHIGHIPNEHDLARDEHMDPINVRIAQLTEALESVITEQKYLKARDSRHRYIHVAEVVSRGATWADHLYRDIWGTAEVFCGNTGIRDKRIRDKSPRMREDFSLGKDKTLRGFILILRGVQD
ncbi:hypothetical protein TEA_019982 [Camellia sinensis var. sinensis]|uniref:GOLD domain-containing protein n=1 Tax=Camellia sinensis var. sinensis TaxID=542762 RepID=A0A4S4DUW4_CAMSN|nr:hypothetical protein TEA_019982 [Camellia sinensis var. sinensis]